LLPTGTRTTKFEVSVLVASRVAITTLDPAMMA
jgi:hypothetical protein